MRIEPQIGPHSIIQLLIDHLCIWSVPIVFCNQILVLEENSRIELKVQMDCLDAEMLLS